MFPSPNGCDSAHPTGHAPVLLEAMLAHLAPQPGKVYVDATFGGGGYTKAILESSDCTVIAIDRDCEAAARAAVFQQKYGERFSFFLKTFGTMASFLPLPVDGIVFDFGVSSFQIDTASRGFSFQQDGPLDMRMGTGDLTAFEVINHYSEQDLADIIFTYGQERFARKITRAILNERKKHPINSTLELAQIIRSVVPARTAINPATKTFQAIRIFVNDELREISNALEQITQNILPAQHKPLKVVTVAFHSLEDKIVKNWIAEHQRNPTILPSHRLHVQTQKVITPTKEECDANPRSRSARLRSVVWEPVGGGE